MAILATLVSSSRLGLVIPNWYRLGWLADTLVDRLHHVLQVREDVCFGGMAVVGHNLAINNYVKFPVGPRGELEVVYMLAGPG